MSTLASLILVWVLFIGVPTGLQLIVETMVQTIGPEWTLVTVLLVAIYIWWQVDNWSSERVL